MEVLNRYTLIAKKTMLYMLAGCNLKRYPQLFYKPVAMFICSVSYKSVNKFPMCTFAQVVWRYHGKTPETLAANTKLYDWIPQNDLLGKERVVCVLVIAT